ncbi:Ribonuclease H-like superfamily protein [Striga hermonthica]|uniref:Ribonuclease H-like superfamily protein n=1 Tax=Striga hermonthica TaxID=68872 RepID=A0A9N7RJI6_STRHE|nr:Ribonuclease H-like superfamily protein [Striga hermonthica]
MMEIISDYFASLFQSTNPSEDSIRAITDGVPPKVTDSMNQYLCSPFSAEEVKKATFDLGPEQAPGMDGFPGLFYQRFWNIVGQDVCNEVLKVLNDDADIKAWNGTIITLVPKTAHPVSISEYRPISLCNFLYKIVARTLTNRFREILPSVINDFQSAFIPGRRHSLIFFRAETQDADTIQNFLHLYEQASGQVINFAKSSLSFSPNTSPELVAAVKNILKIPIAQRHEIYLGLPTFSVRSKRTQFGYLKERVAHRIQSWSHKYFSEGGRTVLLQSVLQSIPTYAMLCFRIPNSLCEEIERDCANFWWGTDRGSKKMHWCRWETLCKPKCLGGMGFRHLSAFNKALLAKQGWRILKSPDSLLAKVLKARYFRHSDVMSAPLGNNPSFCWRSLTWSRDIITKGSAWKIGDGRSVDIFQDIWLPENLIVNVFPPFIAEEILKINIPNSPDKDDLYWCSDGKGNYSIKEGYKVEMGFFDPPANQSDNRIRKWWKFLWALNIPLKLKCVAGADNLKRNFQISIGGSGVTQGNEDRPTPHIWSPPPKHSIRIDVDASVNMKDDRFGIGGISRDDQGNALFAFGMPVMNPGSVIHCELLAIKEGLEKCGVLHQAPIFIFTDSLLAVQAVTDYKETHGYIRSWAKEIDGLMSKAAVSSRLQHMRRSANNVAHAIAKFASFSNSPFLWKPASSSTVRTFIDQNPTRSTSSGLPVVENLCKLLVMGKDRLIGADKVAEISSRLG